MNRDKSCSTQMSAHVKDPVFFPQGPGNLQLRSLGIKPENIILDLAHALLGVQVHFLSDFDQFSFIKRWISTYSVQVELLEITIRVQLFNIRNCICITAEQRAAPFRTVLMNVGQCPGTVYMYCRAKEHNGGKKGHVGTTLKVANSI